MKILIIGSGGREHAIGYKMGEDSRVSKIYFAPGNAGTLKLGENIDIGVTELSKLKNFALEKGIDITVVGPEVPLNLGIVDVFKEAGLKIFGPDKNGAQLESSKAFSKAFMQKYNIPTAKYEAFTNYLEAEIYLKAASFPLVLKADGLAAGKGVLICESLEDALKGLKEIMQDKIFGEQGNKVVVEEFLEGKEVSLLCFTDGKTIIPMETASDYKRALDGDKGLNTGGMGSISPSPYYATGLADDIVSATLNGIVAENFDFRGVIYIGLMLTKKGPMVLEYNVRFGDPETEALLLRLDTSLTQIIEHTIDKTLSDVVINWKKEPAVTVIIAAEGYPENPVKGGEITLPVSEEAVVFHCGTKLVGERLLSDGGRVLAVSAMGEDFAVARKKCYDYAEKIDFSGSFYRKDIGVI